MHTESTLTFCGRLRRSENWFHHCQKVISKISVTNIRKEYAHKINSTATSSKK